MVSDIAEIKHQYRARDSRGKGAGLLMNQLFDAITWNLNGIGIEQESFRRIDAEAAPEIRARFSDAEWHVARRLVHTTADFAILDQLEFRNNAVEAGLAALRGGL